MDSYHFWEDREYAGPRPSDVACFWDRRPRQLRPQPRLNLPKLSFDSGHLIIPKEAQREEAHEIATFWNTHYKAATWHFKATVKTVEYAIERGFILVARVKSGAIAGTFVCRILSEVVCGSTATAGLLEGFVIHERYRKQGMGSLLLAYMDRVVYAKPTLKTALLMWFREHDSPTTAIAQLPTTVLRYTFCLIHKLSAATRTVAGAVATQVSSEVAGRIVSKIYKKHERALTILSADTTDPDVFWFMAEGALIGIADTHRYSLKEDWPFWEVVFAANLNEPYFTDLRWPIEIAARALPSTTGVLFASNSLTRGNMAAGDSNWIVGGGYLSAHVYNWMPPAFFSGDLLFPHSCL